MTADVPGTRYLLHSDEIGSLGIGSPLYYRRIEVGQVVSFALDPDGRGVSLQVFVNAPYDQYVTSNTRFWHASGVDISLDATGVKVDTASLAAIIAGGVAFQAPPDLPPAEPGAGARRQFNLVSRPRNGDAPHRHRGAARRSSTSRSRCADWHPARRSTFTASRSAK